MSSLPIEEGTVPFSVNGETYETFYKVFGDRKQSTQPPLVVLHGGPGLSHYYLVNHMDLASRFNIPVIMYDQIGGGKSTHLPHKGADFWTIELMCDQLEQFLDHMGIGECWNMYGHSWGGIIGAYYVATRKPQGLKLLVVHSAPASIPLVDKSIASIVAEFPSRIREAIRLNNNREPYNKDDLEGGMKIFGQQHVCRLDPWPEAMIISRKIADEDNTVNRHMCVSFQTCYLDLWS